MICVLLYLILLPVTNSYPQRMWGEWRVLEQHNGKLLGTTKVCIFPRRLDISIRKTAFGGIITCQKELTGSYYTYSDLSNRQTKLNVDLESEIKTIDSFLGIEVRLRKEKNKIRSGNLDVTLLDITNDVMVIEMINNIKACSEVNNKQEFLLVRKRPTDDNITPINLFLIGQFVGFVTSHIFDSLLEIFLNKT